MSDDEAYDADGDVGRFLQCASPGGHMLPLDGTLGGLFQNAPPTHVQVPPAAPPTLNPPAPATYGAEHDEVAPVIDDDAEDHQLPGMDDLDDQYQEMAIDVQPAHNMMMAPEMQQGYGVHGEHYNDQVPIMDNQHYPAPTINNSGHQDQEPIMDAEYYDDAAIVDGEHHQVPAMDDDSGKYEDMMAMDMMQRHDGGVDSMHYDAPAMDVEPPQHDAMAMDAVPPATQMPQANGGLPNPTPWLEGSSMFADPPSPTMCRMLDELAVMLQGVDGGAGGAEAAAEGVGDNAAEAADDGEDNAAAASGGAGAVEEGGGDNAAGERGDDVMGPALGDVMFKPITHGQLDCTRCRSVREVLAIDWPSQIHFAVHSTYPETFEHAITHRMLMGTDGLFHTRALLYLDLRGRRVEWVESFIAKSVDTMKRRNAGMVQDTNDASTSNNNGTVVGGDNNVISAPQPSNHGHMDLEVGMLNNLLSSTAAATDQAANPLGAQPVQEQGNTDDAPPVAEAASHEAAAVQPAVTQAQENTDALSVAEAAVPPEAAETAVTQKQESPDAPPLAVPAPATSRAENRTDNALDRFPAFNWEGFKPDILESSLVEPYDPASGVNVLMYPSMLEQLQLEQLKKEESKKLSKMTVEETPDYLNINDDHYANAPNFASAIFKLLCQRDPTYRMFKRRVSGLNRKIKKLEQGSKRVGTGGLFKIKQKMETCKQEKEELYDVIKRGMQELENERRNNDGAGPSNHAAAGPSNSLNLPGPSNGAGPSNAAGTSSNDDAGPSSSVSGNSDDDAGPSNVAGTSSNAAASPSSAADPSNVAGPSGTK